MEVRDVEDGPRPHRLRAHLDLVGSGHEREVVVQGEVLLALQAGEDRAPEDGAGILPPGKSARGAQGQVHRPARPRCVAHDGRLVGAVEGADLVEAGVAQGRGPVGDRVPDRAPEVLTRFLHRQRAAALVLVDLVRVVVAEGDAVVLVQVGVQLEDEGQVVGAGGDEGVHTLGTPVFRDPEHGVGVAVQLLDAGEEEQPVLHHGPAQEAAEAALGQGRRLIEELRLAVLEEARVRRGVEGVVAEEAVRPALETVRTAARDHVQDPPRGGAELRGVGVGHDLEFLDPVLGEAGGAGPVVLPFIARTVHEDPVGVPGLPVDGQRLPVAAEAGGDAGRELGQRAEVPLHGGQVVDLVLGDDGADGVLGGLDDGRVLDHLHRFLQAAQLEAEVHVDFLADAQHEARALAGGELRHLGRHCVGARGQVGEEVLTQGARGHAAHLVGVDVAGAHGGAGQGAALLVGNGAPEGGRDRLRAGRGCAHGQNGGKGECAGEAVAETHCALRECCGMDALVSGAEYETPVEACQRSAAHGPVGRPQGRVNP